ncbi:MAG: CpsD/CapB family tyrosine-protein kinase [Pseudomonadota bacterium]
MVERLKVAVEKARAMRKGVANVAQPVAKAVEKAVKKTAPAEPQRTASADLAWSELESINFDDVHLERNRIITRNKNDPAYIAFDVLRTRIMRAFKKNGWTRLGITSPTKGCGKTFISANLALSMSRQQTNRTILMDMDLRLPALAKVLGVRHNDPARWFLSGEMEAEDFLRSVDRNLAIGLNSERVRDAAELIQDPSTTEVLTEMNKTYEPDIVVYDLPPMLSCDDVIGFIPNIDCILLVTSGDRTRPDAITECERLLQDQVPLLGVLLNKAELTDANKYGYEYGYS